MKTDPIRQKRRDGNRLSVSIHLNKSDALNGLGRALSRAGAALQALALVDLIVKLAHINCLSRALGCAGTTGQALIGNNKSHDIPSTFRFRI